MVVIGVLGGGQLGRMLQLAASPFFNFRLRFLDAPNAPAKQVQSASDSKKDEGSFKDEGDVSRFAADCDLVTYEIEHVDLKGLIHGNEQPKRQTLEIIQDKLLQKQHYEKHRLATPPFEDVPDLTTLLALERFPCVLKTRTGGYDGRGNVVLRSPADVKTKWSSLQGQSWYIEEFVDFTHELACMVVKGLNGEIKSYEPVVTVQDGEKTICKLVIAPAPVARKARDEARKLAEKAISTFDGAGIFGVEMFLLRNGRVMLNEIAPRPHNAGHYTQDACHTSQFENHLRAITGLPLGSTELKVPCAAMLNILGGMDTTTPKPDIPSINMGLSLEDPTFWPALRAMQVEGAHVHIYGKDGIREGRKLGHINVTASSMPELMSKLRTIHPITYPKFDIAPLVSVIMGSVSDMPVMKAALQILDDFNVPHEVDIVSAHRTPLKMVDFAHEARSRGVRVIIAGAGGAAHLPGMTASMTCLPVIGVPVAAKHLDGADSLHSIVQMPRGVPVACVAIDNATNAALLAIRILGTGPGCGTIADKMEQYQLDMKANVESDSAGLTTE